MLGSQKPDELVAQGKVGSILWLKEINRLQHLAVEKSRLHIPILFAYDVIHGYRTVFPIPLAMASSWDPAVEEAAQHLAAQDARAAGILWTFTPMVDIARDARWGRIVEGAGEDPYLGAAMARAQVSGFQGETLGPEKFPLGKDELQFWSPQTKAWAVEPSTFDVWAGEDSTASLTRS